MQAFTVVLVIDSYSIMVINHVYVNETNLMHNQYLKYVIHNTRNMSTLSLNDLVPFSKTNMTACMKVE